MADIDFMEQFKSDLLRSLQFALEDLYNLSEVEAERDAIELYETIGDVMNSHETVFYQP